MHNKCSLDTKYNSIIKRLRQENQKYVDKASGHLPIEGAMAIIDEYHFERRVCMKKAISLVLMLMLLLGLPLSVQAEVYADYTKKLDSSLYMYEAQVLTNASMRREADTKSGKVKSLKRYDKVKVITYGDEWCEIEYKNRTGYYKTAYLFMFRSSDPYKYPIHGYDAPYGIGTLTQEFNTEGLIETRWSYHGNLLMPGQDVTVHAYNPQTDVATILVWRNYLELPAGAVKDIQPFVPYEDAQPGDLIAGYTSYQAHDYGFPYHKARQHNISLVISKLDGAVIQSQELFSYLGIAGRFTKGAGYREAYITGGDGRGIGGGVCQISILTRSAVLMLPFIQKDWSMHTYEGSPYTTQICDATVGNNRDFSFYNMLPYAIRFEYENTTDVGVMNLRIYRDN